MQTKASLASLGVSEIPSRPSGSVPANGMPRRQRTYAEDCSRKTTSVANRHLRDAERLVSSVPPSTKTVRVRKRLAARMIVRSP